MQWELKTLHAADSWIKSNLSHLTNTWVKDKLFQDKGKTQEVPTTFTSTGQMTQNIKMDKTRGYLAHNNEIGHSKKEEKEKKSVFQP